MIFFEESPISFIRSPFGWGYIVVMYVLAFIFGFGYRLLLKKSAKGTPAGAGMNIRKFDRIIRLSLWRGLLVLAVTTSWKAWLLFLSGLGCIASMNTRIDSVRHPSLRQCQGKRSNQVNEEVKHVFTYTRSIAFCAGRQGAIEH